MRVLILGGNSDIALAAARCFAHRERADLVMASRNMDVLEKRADDIRVRYGVRAEAVFFDALDTAGHAAFYRHLEPKPDVVVVAFGDYADQTDIGDDAERARAMIETNFIAVVSILSPIAEDFERRGHGCIIGIGSVAGLRGRGSNYIYGASKAGMAAYLSGLRNRLCKRGVHVMTVLPGFVRTKMTEGLDLPGALTADPAHVGADIHAAWQRRCNVLYSRWFWRWIMLVIRLIPEPIFKRLSL